MSQTGRKEAPDVFPELMSTPEQDEVVGRMLKEADQDAPRFWEGDVSEHLYVPVDDGEIRVLHYKPENPVSKRPVAFVPGWGVTPIGFYDFFKVLYNRAECYYIETREKGSSRIDRKKARLDLHQKAKDVADALDYLGLLDGRDFLLMAPCWGAAVLLTGLLDKRIKAPTIIVADPMHTLWFPKWVIRYIGPWVSPFIVEWVIKPIVKPILLGNMKEPVQKMRAETFIKEATIWKWRKAAIQVRSFELYDSAQDIHEHLFVLNGTIDKVHEQSDYPRLARLMPNSRFIFMNTTEDNRERLMGLVALEFSKVGASEDIPPVLREFEKEVQRRPGNLQNPNKPQTGKNR